MKTIVIALRATIVTLVLTGLAYPLAMTGAARVLFPRQAAGSLVTDDAGKVVGSRLIGQAFTDPEYFQGRPSAAGNGYDATSSGGSNLGATSAKLRDRARADVARLQKENPEAAAPVPGELVTASGSGLDPHLSPAAARWQIPRVARARNIARERIEATLQESIEGRDLGLFGEPTINVLMLNLTLDRQFGKPPSRTARPAAASAGGAANTEPR
jgi:potassium-transporting ATPase KdpC subunit